MKQKKISHIRFATLKKIYWTLGNTIESDVFKIYDRDDDRGPRNRDPKIPTATDREPRPGNRDRDRDTTSAKNCVFLTIFNELYGIDEKHVACGANFFSALNK